MGIFAPSEDIEDGRDLPIREEMHEDRFRACEARSSAHRRTRSETFARIGMAEAMRISPWAGTPFSRSEEERCFPRTGSPETVSPHGDHLLRDAVPAGRLTHQGCAARTACLREARGRRSRPASVERRPERALHVSGRPDRLRTITSAISVVWRLSNLGTAAPRPLRSSSLAPLQAQSRPRQKPRRPPPRGSRASERTPRPPEVKGERRGPSDANRTLAAAGRGNSSVGQVESKYGRRRDRRHGLRSVLSVRFSAAPFILGGPVLGRRLTRWSGSRATAGRRCIRSATRWRPPTGVPGACRGRSVRRGRPGSPPPRRRGGPGRPRFGRRWGSRRARVGGGPVSEEGVSEERLCRRSACGEGALFRGLRPEN